MTRRKSTTEKSRFTLWLPADSTAELARLQELLGKASIAEVVRDAIDVYSRLLEARKQGVELYYKRADSEEEGVVWVLPGPVPKSSSKGQ